ncbi:MFS transporter [Alteromonas pelagimontana]|uniref:MFS transporter n=1 Tax=Alteromonas pelagimontana TaxID=1858656 RepID=A0A6M4MC29_9ALTE|nr:MFS transporter [Alteromonas pelagimontana]QJR80703.1 MFS transporter [Alteromonas pelagimontana]
MSVTERLSVSFYVFLIGRAVFSAIDAIVVTSIAWHLYESTKDPFDLALVGLFQIAPIYLFFVLTGWVVDHVSRKRILQIGAVVQLAVLIMVALLMQSGDFNKWYLLGLIAGLGSVKAFLSPALQAILPNLVTKSQLSSAIALTSTVWNVSLTGGPFIAGLLIALLNFKIYWVIVALALITSVCFFWLPPIKAANTMKRSASDLWRGFSFLRDNRIVLGSLLLDLLIVLGGSVVALLPIYASDILKIGPEGLGLLRSMPAIGAVLVGIYLTRYKTEFENTGRTLFTALSVFSLSVILFALTDNVWLSCTCLFIYGASDMFSVVIRGAAIHHNTPDELRGRVSALNSIFIASSNQLGDFRAGSVAAVAGPVNAALIGGVTSVAVVVWGYSRFTNLRKLKSSRVE